MSIYIVFVFFIFYAVNAVESVDCPSDGLYCVMDGEHDYQYYECSADFKGFRNCAPGTKCKGEAENPYTYNPCVEYPYTPSEVPTESSTKPVSSTTPTSSEGPTTPSVGTSSTVQSSSTVTPNPFECKEDGLYCVIDGVHDYQYYECSADFKGFRQCAPGTKCKGEQNQPYTYNPCVEYPFTQSEQQTQSSSTKPVSSEPTTPSVGLPSSEKPTQSSSTTSTNPMECKENGLYCVMDGQHDYMYYECSADFKGFRQCAPGTKCKGEAENPYTYNPCVIIDPKDNPVESSSSTTPTSSEGPTTPSVGIPSSETPQQSSTEYNPMECKVDGLYCVIDGVHDYQYYECSADFKGFRQCAPGTKCKGEQTEPYTYNPCVEYPYTPSTIPTESSSSTKPVSSEPTTPSVGTSSTQPSQSSSTTSTNPMECKEDGLYCVMDGEHDYMYYECSANFKGFRQCAPGTKCKGEAENPYSYNPCVEYPYTPSTIPTESSSSTTPTSSEGPTTPSVGTSSTTSTQSSSSTTPVPTDCSVDGFFCVMDGIHDNMYLECSEFFKGFRQCAPGTKCKGEEYNPFTYNPCVTYDSYEPPVESSTQPTSSEPTTPSVGTSSTVESSSSQTPVPTDCSVDGFFCVMDGIHDYQYLECNIGYQGFRNCAPGTKCRGEEFNPYTYNPCVAHTQQSEQPTESSTKPVSSETPTESSSTKPVSSTTPVSSEGPITPSVGTSSEQPIQSSSSTTPVPTDCSVDGFFCVMDGNHDYQYLECSSGYKGFRQCAPGTKCKGEAENPYSYNPCVITDPKDNPVESSTTKPTSSEGPTTPSVGTSSTQPSQSSSTTSTNPMECKEDGLYCVMDGIHDYQYYECSADFKGFRQCAPGTKCKGEAENPYSYNPCVEYPYTPSEVPTESSTKPVSSTTPTSSEGPTTPSVGTSSNQQNMCQEDGFFCVMDGNHDYQYLECSSGYKGFRNCAPGTKCAGEQEEPYKFNPCVIIDPKDNPVESSSTTKPASSEGPTTPSVGTPTSSEKPTESQEEVMSCGEFECNEDGLYCQIDGIRNNRYCECATTFKGSRPCAPGTWCNGEQNQPYEYNPCVFIDQTTWFGNITYSL